MSSINCNCNMSCLGYTYNNTILRFGRRLTLPYHLQKRSFSSTSLLYNNSNESNELGVYSNKNIEPKFILNSTYNNIVFTNVNEYDKAKAVLFININPSNNNGD